MTRLRLRLLLAPVLAVAGLLSLGPPAANAQEAPPLYELDPVVDGSISAMALGFAGFSEVAIRSGELRPQPPRTLDSLIFLDRWVAERDEPTGGSSLLSTGAVLAMMAWGITDSLLTEYVRTDVEGQGWAQMVIYAETVILNWAIGNMAKLAVRRPRPESYAAERLMMPREDTDVALSFYSVHTALSAGLTATASYFAFTRDPGSVEAWLTLGAGAAITVFTGVQRMLALAHFPTDVIAGALFGTGIGLLVPHLHRADTGAVIVAPMTDGQSTAGLAVSGLL